MKNNTFFMKSYINILLIDNKWLQSKSPIICHEYKKKRPNKVGLNN